MPKIKNKEEALRAARKLAALRLKATELATRIEEQQEVIVRFLETKNIKGMLDPITGFEYVKQQNCSVTYDDDALGILLGEKGVWDKVYSTVTTTVRNDQALAELLRNGDIETETLLPLTTYHYSRPFIKTIKKRKPKAPQT